MYTQKIAENLQNTRFNSISDRHWKIVKEYIYRESHGNSKGDYDGWFPENLYRIQIYQSGGEMGCIDFP